MKKRKTPTWGVARLPRRGEERGSKVEEDYVVPASHAPLDTLFIVIDLESTTRLFKTDQPPSRSFLPCWFDCKQTHPEARKPPLVLGKGIGASLF